MDESCSQDTYAESGGKSLSQHSQYGRSSNIRINLLLPIQSLIALHKPLLPGIYRSLCPVHQMQLAQDIADIALDG
jgi:hypothetical protein